MSTRGLVFVDRGEDDKLHFSLRCTEGLEASTVDSVPAVFVPDGSLTLGIFSGVYNTVDRGCTLQLGTGLPESSFTMAVGHPSMPGRLLTSMRTVEKQAQLFLSEDYGRSWSPHYDIPAGDLHDALLIAPSDPQRVYAVGRRIDAVAKKMSYLSSVSLDWGANWQDTALETVIVPFAVHARNADVVFAYHPTDASSTVFDVLRSEDQGVHFTTVLEGVQKPTSIAVSSTGSPLWLGIGGAGGLYRSADDGRSFEQVLADTLQSVTCLAQRGQRLWVCGNERPNTNGVWFSEDDGKTLQTFMTYVDVEEPVACDGEPQALCAGPWLDFYRDQHPPDADGGVPDAAAGSDMAQDASPSSGGELGADASAGGALDALDADASAEGAGSELDASAGRKQHHAAGCQLRAAQRGAPGWQLLLAALLPIASRRRRAARA